MFTNLETYQSRFWLKEEFLKKIGKSSSGFLLELFSRVDALVDQDLVYYDHQMDMETCFEKYSFQIILPQYVIMSLVNVIRTMLPKSLQT